MCINNTIRYLILWLPLSVPEACQQISSKGKESYEPSLPTVLDKNDSIFETSLQRDLLIIFFPLNSSLHFRFLTFDPDDNVGEALVQISRKSLDDLYSVVRNYSLLT